MILSVTFEEIEHHVDAYFEETEHHIDADFGEIIEMIDSDIPRYEGDLEIVPTFADQTLDTSGLLLEEDIKIEQIPIARVSNNAGGMTVIIGG